MGPLNARIVRLERLERTSPPPSDYKTLTDAQLEDRLRELYLRITGDRLTTTAGPMTGEDIKRVKQLADTIRAELDAEDVAARLSRSPAAPRPDRPRDRR